MIASSTLQGAKQLEETLPAYAGVCARCGARRIDRQIGLEETPEEWCDRLVEVFREVRRVLRDDGTLWVEIGDSYDHGSNKTRGEAELRSNVPNKDAHGVWVDGGGGHSRHVSMGLKSKDLMGQPWLLAFALRADGWYLRSEIIWARPNPMPESVTDRPTKAHSTVFLLSKQPRYFYDAEAIREIGVGRTDFGAQSKGRMGNGATPYDVPKRVLEASGANARSVWTIATEPTPFAHFATWPQALCCRMILAGTSERGVCPECGAPWVREVEKTANGRVEAIREHGLGKQESRGPHGLEAVNRTEYQRDVQYATVGWRPSCECAENDERILSGTQDNGPPHPIPATVLDPFGGSGTTAIVARKLGRRAVLIELNPDYCQLASRRLSQQSLFAEPVA